MYKHLLNKGFLADNPIEEHSSARVGLVVLKEDVSRVMASDLGDEDVSEERRENIQRERAEIEAMTDPAQIIKAMRAGVDPFSRFLLREKALSMEEEVAPVLFARFLRSGLERLIESAVEFFAFSEANYAYAIVERWQEIRSPYALSQACLVVGLRGEESAIPWLMERYEEFLCEEDEEEMEELNEQGPLIALHEMYERFYAR